MLSLPGVSVSKGVVAFPVRLAGGLINSKSAVVITFATKALEFM